MPDQEQSLHIRSAHQQDTPAIVALWKQLMEFHSTRDPWFQMCEEGCGGFTEHIKHCMADDRALLLVAEMSGHVVGYCLAETVQRQPVFSERSFAVISDLAVDEGSRRKGVGRKLVTAMLSQLKDRDIRRTEVTVATCNEVSTAFWRGLGFKLYMEKLYLT